jgi:hypothetical protein
LEYLANMAIEKVNRRFIKVLRGYPFFLLGALSLAYLCGGFSDNPQALLPKKYVYDFLTLVLGVVPIGFMIGFILIGRATDRQFLRNSTDQEKFSYTDALELPTEVMRGYKLALIRGREPTLTGITGDTYGADDNAVCKDHPEHVPPVKNCQCGFHAYRDISDAQFERSINNGSFLLNVELYGLGFIYSRGFRAESQVVKNLLLPRRCMRCKTFQVHIFVGKYLVTNDYTTIWQWDARCKLCSSFTKDKDKLSISEMGERLNVEVVEFKNQTRAI